MVFRINEDIFLETLMPLLDHNDTVFLLLACKTFYSYSYSQLVWKHLYNQAYAFEDGCVPETVLNNNWYEQYKSRSGAKVFIWRDTIDNTIRDSGKLKYRNCFQITNFPSSPVGVHPNLGISTRSGDHFVLPDEKLKKSTAAVTLTGDQKINKIDLGSLISSDDGGFGALGRIGDFLGLSKWKKSETSKGSGSLRRPKQNAAIEDSKFDKNINSDGVSRLVNRVYSGFVIGVSEIQGIIVGNRHNHNQNKPEDEFQEDTGSESIVGCVKIRLPIETAEGGLLTDLLFLRNDGTLFTASSFDIEFGTGDHNYTWPMYEYSKVSEILKTIHRATDNSEEASTAAVSISHAAAAADEDNDDDNNKEEPKIVRVVSIPFFQDDGDELVAFSNKGDVIMTQRFYDWPNGYVYRDFVFPELQHVGCIDVCATYMSYFALLENGTVLRWSRNDRYYEKIRPIDITSNGKYKVFQISASGDTFCAIMSEVS